MSFKRRFKRRLITTGALLASITALTAGSAAAMPVYRVNLGHDRAAQSVTNPYTGQPVVADVAPTTYSRQDKQVVGPALSAPASAVPVKAPAPAGGSTLEYLGIALGGLALALLALTGAVAVSRSRFRRTHGQAALTH